MRTLVISPTAGNVVHRLDKKLVPTSNGTIRLDRFASYARNNPKENVELAIVGGMGDNSEAEVAARWFRINHPAHAAQLKIVSARGIRTARDFQRLPIDIQRHCVETDIRYDKYLISAHSHQAKFAIRILVHFLPEMYRNAEFACLHSGEPGPYKVHEYLALWLESTFDLGGTGAISAYIDRKADERMAAYLKRVEAELA